MVQRPDHVALLLPLAGHPSVQRREPVRATAPQVRPQLGAQEGMDPEGAARGTGPGDERRRALQVREHVPGVGALREDGGERGGDLVADTDGGEHVRDVGGHSGEDLAGEVVREVRVSGEVAHQPVGVGRPAERARREGQRRRPALRLRAQEVEPVGAHRDPGGGEQGRRLVPGEREVAGAQVDDLLTQPEAVEPQRRVGPRGEHQQQVGGPVAHERGQPVQRLRCGDGVDVVEDQGDRARRGEGVDDRRDERRVPARRRPAAAVPTVSSVRSAPGTPPSAASRPAQNRSSASSSASSVTQAPARSTSQSARSCVLPNPAGAQTTTTCPGAARSSTRVSRGRGRKDGDGRGRVHFAGDTSGHPAMSTRRTLRPACTATSTRPAGPLRRRGPRLRQHSRGPRAGPSSVSPGSRAGPATGTGGAASTSSSTRSGGSARG